MVRAMRTTRVKLLMTYVGYTDKPCDKCVGLIGSTWSWEVEITEVGAGNPKRSLAHVCNACLTALLLRGCEQAETSTTLTYTRLGG